MKKIGKGTKIILIALVLVLLLALAAFLVLRSGILVKPTDQILSGLKTIPSYDVLAWQQEREEEILADYQSAEYTFKDPYLIIDPYEMNPLAALLIFEANSGDPISVTVVGDDAYGTLTYEKVVQGNRAEIPIVGLYAGRENIVRLANANGEETELIIETEPLPADFQTFELQASVPEKMEPGMTLFTACFSHSYSAVLDHKAQVRAYLSNNDMAHGTAMIQLKNGNMLSTGDEYKQVPYNMASLWEYNWLGKIFIEYEVPNAVHHDVRELSNGDFLAVSNHANMFQSGSREDVAIILDRTTGEVKRSYDFRNIIDETREAYHHFHPNLLNTPVVDWMHMNTAIMDEETQSLIVSSPTGSQVVCIDASTEEIQWILGSHDGYEGNSAFMKPYLLTPADGDFEWSWGQHHPMILPDFDENPDTLDLLLFDNGQSRSFTKENAIDPNENYSRAVHYRINRKAMTVEQIWQYGKERGVEAYATFLGDANYYPATGNRLITFGGQIYVDGMRTDDIVSGVMGETATRSRVSEVTEDKELVYEVAVQEDSYTKSGETYQATRLTLYSPESYQYQLGQRPGIRLGSDYVCYPAVDMNLPPLYTRNVEVAFERIFVENGRLVAIGDITYQGKSYAASRAVFVLRSKTNDYLYTANNGLNGRFFMSLDTSELEPGEYQLSIAAGFVDGNDVLNDKLLTGHVRTDYKLVVQ